MGASVIPSIFQIDLSDLTGSQHYRFSSFRLLARCFRSSSDAAISQLIGRGEPLVSPHGYNWEASSVLFGRCPPRMQHYLDAGVLPNIHYNSLLKERWKQRSNDGRYSEAARAFPDRRLGLWRVVPTQGCPSSRHPLRSPGELPLEINEGPLFYKPRAVGFATPQLLHYLADAHLHHRRSNTFGVRRSISQELVRWTPSDADPVAKPGPRDGGVGRL